MKAVARAVVAVILGVALGAPEARCAELVIGLAAQVTSIDPHHSNLGPNGNIADHLFGALLLNDERLQLKPGLADSWRALDDTTWEFRLRKGVTFQDRSEFTANDVVFSLDRPAQLSGVPGGLAVFTRPIIEKIVVDPYTIRLKTATPHPTLPADIRAVPIVSKA